MYPRFLKDTFSPSHKVIQKKVRSIPNNCDKTEQCEYNFSVFVLQNPFFYMLALFIKGFWNNCFIIDYKNYVLHV